ncbi:MAG: YggT family protein [Candidatus Moduliflexus flocculans]|nr:YggT family protein [Candidatus Moduliflexus flocculans]
MDSYNSPTTKPLYRGTQVVWYILGLIEVLLAFRFVLKLLAANPQAGFSSFIYAVSYPFAAPFLNVFHASKVESGVFEWTTLAGHVCLLFDCLGHCQAVFYEQNSVYDGSCS